MGTVTAPRCLALLAYLVATTMLLLVAGCGKDEARYQWERRLLTADRMVDHKNYQDARSAYIALQTDPDKDAAHPNALRYIDYRLAYIYEKEGRYDDAIAGYQSIANTGIHDELSGKAAFRIGYATYTHLKRPEDGLKAWEHLITTMPETIAAGKALREVLGHYKRLEQTQELLAFIERLHPQLSESEIGDNLMYRYAQHLQSVGRIQDAENAYLRVIDDYPLSGLVDDAQWELSELYQKLERHNDALPILETLAEDIETSWIVGTYNSEFADNARIRRGLIFLEQFRQFADAEVEFRIFLEDFPYSLLRDDVRWNIVQCRLADADAPGARGACRDLRDLEPESRWLDDCQAIVSALENGKDPRSLQQKAVE